MKILLTGATGFVGRHLAPLLMERGHTLLALARSEKQFAEHSWSPRTTRIVCDIERECPRFDAAPDAIVHLAWPCLGNYFDSQHTDIALSAHFSFLEHMVRSGVQHVIVTGTCLEYGLHDGCLSELTPANPSVPYAVAKNSLRRMLVALQERVRFKLRWARLFYMHGPGQPQRALLSQLDEAIRSGKSVFDMSRGDQLRDYLAVEDVAKRLACIVEALTEDGVFNVCSGTPISIRALVERHIRSKGAKIDLRLGVLPYPTYEPHNFWGDNTKLRGLCGND